MLYNNIINILNYLDGNDSLRWQLGKRPVCVVQHTALEYDTVMYT